MIKVELIKWLFSEQEPELERWCKTREEVWEFIQELAKINNLGYYYRYMLDDDGFTWVDFGSHKYFFKYKEEK